MTGLNDLDEYEQRRKLTVDRDQQYDLRRIAERQRDNLEDVLLRVQDLADQLASVPYQARL